MIDERFIYPSAPTWRNAKQQSHNGEDFETLDPISKTGNSYEFELTSNSAVFFGALTGFKVTGSFQVKDSADETLDPIIPKSAYTEVRIQPNWFDHCIKSIDVFHNHTNLRPHETPPYVDNHLNAYLMAHMDKFAKRYLYPETHSPGYSLPTSKDSWSVKENSDWHKYSEKIFGHESITFKYIPLHIFPFYQHSNFMVDGNLPNAIYMHGLGKFTIRINFKDSFEHLFRKTSPTSTKTYDFLLDSVKLLYQEVHLSSGFEKSLLSSKRLLNFAGVTKFGMTENIPAGVLSHRMRFQDILLPEGIFIFALPTSVVGGQYKYSTSTDEQLFSEHNIGEVKLEFNGMPFAIKSPSFGNIKNDFVEYKIMLDHLEKPPFGMWQDPDLVTLKNVKNGSKNTAFPHVYLNLCPSRKPSRIIPIGDDGSIINTTSDLDLTLTFNAGGASSRVTYFVYVFYTDVNMTLDLKTKRFVPFYKRARSST